MALYGRRKEMSKLRPECIKSDEPALPDDTALFLISKSIAARRSLIYGRLDGPDGEHCAIGAFWHDNPGITLHSRLVDEVATVNDSIPPSAPPRLRWKAVNSWLRFKIA